MDHYSFPQHLASLICFANLSFAAWLTVAASAACCLAAASSITKRHPHRTSCSCTYFLNRAPALSSLPLLPPTVKFVRAWDCGGRQMELPRTKRGIREWIWDPAVATRRTVGVLEGMGMDGVEGGDRDGEMGNEWVREKEDDPFVREFFGASRNADGTTGGFPTEEFFTAMRNREQRYADKTDKDIWNALSSRAGFARVSKQLSEAVRSRNEAKEQLKKAIGGTREGEGGGRWVEDDEGRGTIVGDEEGVAAAAAAAAAARGGAVWGQSGDGEVSAIERGSAVQGDVMDAPEKEAEREFEQARRGAEIGARTDSGVELGDGDDDVDSLKAGDELVGVLEQLEVRLRLERNEMTPTDVIEAVLAKLKSESGNTQGRGDVPLNQRIEALLDFMSESSAFGSVQDPSLFEEYIQNSLSYSVLLNWDIKDIKKLDMSTDGTKAYQVVRLRDARNGAWHRVKWTLSRRDDRNWYVDTVLVQAKSG